MLLYAAWIVSLQGRGVKVASVGPALDLTFPVSNLGNDTSTLIALAEGRHPFAAVLARAKKPLVVVGSGVLQRKDRETVLSALHSITEHVSTNLSCLTAHALSLISFSQGTLGPPSLAPLLPLSPPSLASLLPPLLPIPAHTLSLILLCRASHALQW